MLLPIQIGSLPKTCPTAAEKNVFYCFGKVDDGILTVRFTYRHGIIRIIGAGYWRKGKRIYEQQNQIH